MNELSAKQDQASLSVQSERLRSLFQIASAQLRGGEDATGIESLLYAISELEDLVKNDQNSLQPRIDLALLLPAVRSLYFYIRNKDIAGTADLLKCAFCSLAEQWMRGCGDL